MSEEADVRSRTSRVQQLTMQKKFVEAVVTSLENPPVNSASDSVKAANAQTVFGALQACSKADVANVVQALTPELEDDLPFLKTMRCFWNGTANWSPKLAVVASYAL
ncbi:Actin- protein 2/3 complex subunit 5 [Aphanomyces cochlioides]|nr:Actin- protein 2/3 complex subunit 5 [Aphanomyces cochlioides]